jgi:TMEM175 potassium channel family protein
VANLEDREIERGTQIERTVYFSDAVIAIAITLLALNLEVPEIPSGSVATELPGRLLELRSQFLSFVISFLVIGNYWMEHHRTFNYIRGYDRRLLLLNFLFLMWVVLMPFSASLLGEYGDQQISVVLYATNMVLAGLTLSWLWRYARSDLRLVTPDVDPRVVRYNNLRGLILPLVFLLSIGVSFLDVFAAELCWVLSFAIRPVLPRCIEQI